jgi:hypothetical protein
VLLRAESWGLSDWKRSLRHPFHHSQIMSSRDMAGNSRGRIAVLIKRLQLCEVREATRVTFDQISTSSIRMLKAGVDAMARREAAGECDPHGSRSAQSFLNGSGVCLVGRRDESFRTQEGVSSRRTARFAA